MYALVFLFLLHTKQLPPAIPDSGRLSQAAECAARPQPMILFLACIIRHDPTFFDMSQGLRHYSSLAKLIPPTLNLVVAEYIVFGV